jgi:hypothetical protein
MVPAFGQELPDMLSASALPKYVFNYQDQRVLALALQDLHGETGHRLRASHHSSNSRTMPYSNPG